MNEKIEQAFNDQINANYADSGADRDGYCNRIYYLGLSHPRGNGEITDTGY